MAADQQPLQFPRPPSLGHDYRLARCEGYRVEGSDGRVGTVADVLFRARHDRPDALVVRVGLFRTRFVVVPVEDVLEILPGEQRLILRRMPTLPETGTLGDLWGRLRR
ncbi:MAG: PRC-barrel domain-containing protein [Gaiellaceae bacterium]